MKNLKEKLILMTMIFMGPVLGQDIFLSFTDGNSAAMYKEAGQVVFKLCASTTKIYNRDCTPHFLKMTRSISYDRYADHTYANLQITPPFNNAGASEVIKKELENINKSVGTK